MALAQTNFSFVRLPVWAVAGFSCSWFAAFVAVGYACHKISSFHSYGEHTHAQVTVAIALSGVVAAWLVVEIFAALAHIANGFRHRYTVLAEPTLETCRKPDSLAPANDSPNLNTTASSTSEAATDAKELSIRSGGHCQDDIELGQKVSENDKDEEGLIQDPEKAHEETLPFLKAAQVPLRAMGEFALILAIVYVCDRTDLVPVAEKMYNPVQFWGLWVAICVAAAFTIRKLSDAKPLQREQTDEWKGWMQLMFLLYHYFEEKEVYNAIRVYIAAYIWMTGYGNYFLYVRGKSFTIRRTLQMLFRLNFFVFFVCVVLNNEYMLYYVAPLHTIFTVFVALVLFLGQKLNESRKGIYIKLVFTFVGVALLYDGPDVIFKSFFGTLPGIRDLLAFHDPLHPEFVDEMHEWHFRSGLDRFIWIVGMVAALHFEDASNFLTYVESKSRLFVGVWRSAVIFTIGVLMVAWSYYVFALQKRAYNALHPFTSFIPIACWLVLRNLVPCLRQRYLYLFAYLGRITLETYILQFHVWMKTTGVNGSPKLLLAPIQGNYWANFALMSVIYLFLSVRCFRLTVLLRDIFIPERLRDIAINCAGVICVASISWILAYAVREVIV